MTNRAYKLEHVPTGGQQAENLNFVDREIATRGTLAVLAGVDRLVVAELRRIIA